MAILKKKMAGKPAMMKRKAQGGITLAKNPDTDEKNALKVDVTKPNKDLSEVTKREGFGEQMKKFYKADMAKADSAKTKAGKIARKAVNTVTKVAFTPHRIVLNAADAASNAIANRKENKAMDKKKMGGKMKKYQAGGVVGKQPKAGMVDPKGAFTKVQERTIAGKKKK
jgi:hypothetical protein